MNTYYRVSGADSTTGKERVVTVQAANELDASARARETGIFVYKVEPDLDAEAKETVRVSAEAEVQALRERVPKGADIANQRIQLGTPASPASGQRAKPLFSRRGIVITAMLLAALPTALWLYTSDKRLQEEAATSHMKSNIRRPAKVKRGMRDDYYAKQMSTAWLADFDEQMRLYDAADAEWWARYNDASYEKKLRLGEERLARQATVERITDGADNLRELNRVLRSVLQDMK